MQAENLLTNAELAQYAPSFDTTGMTPTTISGLINQASAQVLSYCDVSGFLRKTVTETERNYVNTDGELVVSFRRPVVAQGDVVSLNFVQRSYNYSVSLQTNGADNYFIQTGGNYMTIGTYYVGQLGVGQPQPYWDDELFHTITYTGGYSDTVEGLPADLKRATILFLLADQSLNTDLTGVKSFRQGSYSETRESGAGSAAENKATAILDKGGYVRRVP